MQVRASNNIAGAKTTEELASVVSDALAALTNQLSGQPASYSRTPQNRSYPNPSGLRIGDTLVDFTTATPIHKTWNGKAWVNLSSDTTGGGSEGGSSSGGCCEIIVASGIDNPPEFVYASDGRDYIYSS